MKFIKSQIFCAVVLLTVQISTLLGGEVQNISLESGKKVKIRIIDDPEGIFTIDSNNSEMPKQLIMQIEPCDARELEEEARKSGWFSCLSTKALKKLACGSGIGGALLIMTSPVWIACLAKGSPVLLAAMFTQGGIGGLGIGTSMSLIAEANSRNHVTDSSQVTLTLLEQTMMENS